MKKVFIFCLFLLGANQLKADFYCAYARDRFSNVICQVEVGQTVDEAKKKIEMFFYSDKNFVVETARSRYAGKSGFCFFVRAELDGQIYQAIGVGETESFAYDDAVMRLTSKGLPLGAKCSITTICSKIFSF